MCTLTWGINPWGYELHFNRDESRARTRAVPPVLSSGTGMSVIAPRDPDAGGTWISLNEAGLSLALLNNYQSAKQYSGVTSRGLLVDSLCSAANISEVLKRISNEDMTAYNAFDLFIFSADARPIRISWNGDQLSRQAPSESFMSSSGFDTEAVIAGRRELYFQEGGPEAVDFHRSHYPSRSAYSVCMHRPDAKTQSYCKIRVDKTSCEFWYSDGPPCSTELGKPLSIPRPNQND